MNEAIDAATAACRCDDKIFLPRLVPAVAHSASGNLAGARAALDDARRIRSRLTTGDITRFARPDEIAGLTNSGLL